MSWRRHIGAERPRVVPDGDGHAERGHLSERSGGRAPRREPKSSTNPTVPSLRGGQPRSGSWERTSVSDRTSCFATPAKASRPEGARQRRADSGDRSEADRLSEAKPIRRGAALWTGRGFRTRRCAVVCRLVGLAGVAKATPTIRCSRQRENPVASLYTPRVYRRVYKGAGHPQPWTRWMFPPAARSWAEPKPTGCAPEIPLRTELALKTRSGPVQVSHPE